MRLIDTGIEPYLVVSAVKVVIAQRLVRRICKNCVEETQISDQFKQILDESELELLPHVYKGKGYDECKNIGFRGRAPVFEVMPIRSRDLKRIITGGETDCFVPLCLRGKKDVVEKPQLAGLHDSPDMMRSYAACSR